MFGKLKSVITSYSIHYTKLYEDHLPASRGRAACSSPQPACASSGPANAGQPGRAASAVEVGTSPGR